MTAPDESGEQHADGLRRVGGAQHIPRPAAWRLGELMPWRLPLPVSASTVAEAVRSTQHDRPALPATVADARSSAVLVVVVDGDRGAEVLLTKRSLALRNHAGEISFPGGRLDPGETAVDAAVREANEEVGLPPASVDVSGQLSNLSTLVSRSFIMPVVASLRDRATLVPHDPEVAKILWVPLVELARTDTFREEHWGTPPLDRRMDFFELDDETIWGATARILRELLDVVYGPPATRTVP